MKTRSLVIQMTDAPAETGIEGSARIRCLVSNSLDTVGTLESGYILLEADLKERDDVVGQAVAGVVGRWIVETYFELIKK